MLELVDNRSFENYAKEELINFLESNETRFVLFSKSKAIFFNEQLKFKDDVSGVEDKFLNVLIREVKNFSKMDVIRIKVAIESVKVQNFLDKRIRVLNIRERKAKKELV